MTPKQILDSFSETLMQDERILSPQERSLLAALLEHAKSAAEQTSDTEEAVRTVIASAVGETVAQRAFSVLGASIVDKILHSSSAWSTGPVSPPMGKAYRAQQQTARPSRQPQVRGYNSPPPPSPSPAQPQPPRAATDTRVVSEPAVTAAVRPPVLKARCVVLDEFLAPQELDQLRLFALDHEADFQISEVISPEVDSGVVNYEHRRSRVLMDTGRQQELILDRIQTVLPEVLRKLGMEAFPIGGVETQITASNDGDFFCFHSDNGSQQVSSRRLTFVYFFHREPPKFEGGELRIHDTRLEGGCYVSEGTYRAIIPRQNQIVFFPCELMHEITPVICPSGRFADGRFTLNGWLRR